MGGGANTEDLIDRYLRSWQEGDWASLRNCLADEIRFDWGIATYTDPDQLVAAAAVGIEWQDFDLLSSLVTSDRPRSFTRQPTPPTTWGYAPRTI